MPKTYSYLIYRKIRGVIESIQSQVRALIRLKTSKLELDLNSIKVFFFFFFFFRCLKLNSTRTICL